MNLLVTYDITSPRRLTRVAKVLLNYGERVQKSVFELHLGPNTKRTMWGAVKRELDFNSDIVRLYPLCRSCAGDVVCIGHGKPAEPEVSYLIL